MIATASASGKNGSIPSRSIDCYLAEWAGGDDSRRQLVALIHGVLDGACVLAGRIATGSIEGDPARLVGSNTDGDAQKAIDVSSHELFVELLQRAGAAQVLSEEADEPSVFKSSGLAVSIDPIDGSGNVGLGAPVGTIFSVIPFAEGENPFLTAGTSQVAAGYVLFGNTVELGISVGAGVVLATMHPQTGEFLIVREKVRIPEETSELAYNASLQRHMQPGLARYVVECLEGRDGVRARDFNMRWLGSAVGDLHRILLRGGLFFYAADRRVGYENGRLRLQYEANPIAFLMEQAGGKATDGVSPILEKRPDVNHCRTPRVFGSAAEVDLIARYLALQEKD